MLGRTKARLPLFKAGVCYIRPIRPSPDLISGGHDMVETLSQIPLNTLHLYAKPDLHDR